MFGRHDAARVGRDALAHADALHNLARYLTGNAAEAEDLVQEAYARALGGAAQFAEGTNLKAWLFRILRNTYVDLYRRQRHEQGTEAAAQIDSEADSQQWRHVVGGELEKAMTLLPEEARLVILLDVEGFSEAEIAGMLECAPGTVKSRLFRARKALRDALMRSKP